MQAEQTSIDGVRVLHLTAHADARGSFTEAFRASWLGADQRWVQWNISRSRAGVLRGLHLHRLQTDYWVVVNGQIRAALVDLRPESRTYRQAMCLEMDGEKPLALVVPPGVLHGFRTLRDVTLMYLLDQEYNGGDEYGVRWDDPALGLPAVWYEGPEPVLSPRDAGSPMLATFTMP